MIVIAGLLLGAAYGIIDVTFLREEPEEEGDLLRHALIYSLGGGMLAVLVSYVLIKFSLPPFS